MVNPSGKTNPTNRNPSVNDRSGWSSSSLPQGYLQKGYFDSNGYVLQEVIILWAKDIAYKLYNSKMKASQLRNFFNEVRRLETQLRNGAKFEALRSRIWGLDALAANSVKKGNAPGLFHDFIKKNVELASQSEKAFLEGFVRHFESIVAYFPKDKD